MCSWQVLCCVCCAKCFVARVANLSRVKALLKLAENIRLWHWLWRAWKYLRVKGGPKLTLFLFYFYAERRKIRPRFGCNHIIAGLSTGRPSAQNSNNLTMVEILTLRRHFQQWQQSWFCRSSGNHAQRLGSRLHANALDILPACNP